MGVSSCILSPWGFVTFLESTGPSSQSRICTTEQAPQDDLHYCLSKSHSERLEAVELSRLAVYADREDSLMSTVDMSRDDLRSAWGITPGYWLWSSHMRILFVIDGRINLSSQRGKFGLGLVLETLRTPFSWWTSFTVDVAKRDTPMESEIGNLEGLAYCPFKFTDTGFDINAYDQIWFFGDNPYDDSATDNDIPGGSPLDPTELKMLAEWMDHGGGVFAAGDHSILGASMCSKIPRVGTMRRWKQLQDVPTKNGSTRHQTLQPTAENDDQEDDIVLQPVELVFRPFEHPLFCSHRGLIDRFPDHMHEGEVIDDDAVKLDQPLEIPGYSRPEYPFVIPEVLAFGPTDAVSLLQRPRPHVVAYGRTTNLYFKEPVIQPTVMASLLGPSVFGGLGIHKRYGLVSVYDGDLVGLGRVVVDSTWHHWFSFNLVGIQENDLAAYEKMQAYYRNVAMWLARPAQRKGMLVAGIWGVLTSLAPMAFGDRDGPWEIGAGILSVLPRTLTLCMLRDFVAGFYDLRVLAASAPSEPPRPEPSWASLPEDLVNRALVGGIGSALLDLALRHQAALARGERPRLNPEAIRQRAVDGVSRAHVLLKKSVDDAASAFGALRETLATSTVPPVDVHIPVDVRRLRVVAEALQFPDATDPALFSRRVTLTIRIKLDSTVLAYQILEDIALPSFKAHGGIIELNRQVGEIEVQTGESLTVEVLMGRWQSEAADSEAIRFSDTLRGKASTWIGKIAPARSQAWRLWYSIEDVLEYAKRR